MSSPQSGIGNVHVAGPMHDFSVRGGTKKPAPKPAPKPARQPARKGK